MVMPYAKLEDNYYALAAQAIIFFNLMSSLAQPLDAAMDVVLSTLLIGFTALSVLLSTPFGKKLKKLFAKCAKKRTKHAKAADKATTSSAEEDDGAAAISPAPAARTGDLNA